MKRKNPTGLKVVLGDTEYEILESLSMDEGKSTSELADDVELSESTLSKHITTLRGLGLVSRHRDEDNGGLLVYLTERGEKFLSEKNPKVKFNELEVRQMAVSVKISDDICEELEKVMEEEEIDSYAEAVDYALADYFDLLEEESTEEQELENR